MHSESLPVTRRLSHSEAAVYLHCSERTLRRLGNRGKVPYFQATPRTVRLYRVEDLDAFIEARTRGARSA